MQRSRFLDRRRYCRATWAGCVLVGVCLFLIHTFKGCSTKHSMIQQTQLSFCNGFTFRSQITTNSGVKKRSRLQDRRLSNQANSSGVPVGKGGLSQGRTRGARGAAAAQPVPGLLPSCSRTIGRHSDPSRGRFRAPLDSCPSRSLTPASERHQRTLARALARPQPRRTSATSVPSQA